MHGRTKWAGVLVRPGFLLRKLSGLVRPRCRACSVDSVLPDRDTQPSLQAGLGNPEVLRHPPQGRVAFLSTAITSRRNSTGYGFGMFGVLCREVNTLSSGSTKVGAVPLEQFGRWPHARTARRAVPGHRPGRCDQSVFLRQQTFETPSSGGAEADVSVSKLPNLLVYDHCWFTIIVS